MMFDCWKNSCHGATVVPTMAMISSTDVEVESPVDPGNHQAVQEGPHCGWLKMARGLTRKLTTTKTYMKRSQLRKLPEAIMAISTDGGDRHGDVLADAEVLERQADADEFGGDGQEVQDERGRRPRTSPRTRRIAR